MRCTKVGCRSCLGATFFGDRKSTRLNSSHSQISYAVFCLKKKSLLQFLTVSSEIRISDGGRTIPIDKVFTSQDAGTGVIFQDANVKVTAVENSHFNFQPSS